MRVLDEWPDFVYWKHMKPNFVERRDDYEHNSNCNCADRDDKSTNAIEQSGQRPCELVFAGDATSQVHCSRLQGILTMPSSEEPVLVEGQFGLHRDSNP